MRPNLAFVLMFIVCYNISRLTGVRLLLLYFRFSSFSIVLSDWLERMSLKCFLVSNGMLNRNEKAIHMVHGVER